MKRFRNPCDTHADHWRYYDYDSSKKAIAEAVMSYLRRVDERMWQIFVMRFWEGLSYKSIGKALPTPITGVRVNQVQDRALRFIRRRFTDAYKSYLAL